MTNLPDELVDVIDEHDRLVRVVTRPQMRAERLWHRSVAVAVFGGDGRLLAQRRSAAKDLWPSRWDIAAGGVVIAGEGYLAAAHRELGEELGAFDLVLLDLGGDTYEDADVATRVRCYRTLCDGPFRFVDGEVTETRWVTRTELDRLRRDEPFVPDSLAVLWPLLEPGWELHSR